MDLSTIIALSVCPAMLGVQEAIRQSQAKTRREEHRARRCNLVIECVSNSIRAKEINGRPIVLLGGRMYINTATPLSDEFGLGSAHPFTGYYLPYPDSPHEGLVTTIQPSPPVLNWVFADATTCALRYGIRVDADAPSSITGPFDCTGGDRRLTLQGWEGFVAVEECPGVWAVYFDKDDDGLRGRVPKGMRVLEIEVQRRETKVPIPKKPTTQTLEEKMAELKKQRGESAAEAVHGEEICASEESLGRNNKLSTGGHQAVSSEGHPAPSVELPSVGVKPIPHSLNTRVHHTSVSDISDEDSTGQPESVFSRVGTSSRRGTGESVGLSKRQTPDTSVSGERDESHRADNECKK